MHSNIKQQISTMQKQQLLLHQPNGGSEGKVFACNVGDLGLIPGSGRSLEKEMATHSSIFAWRIPWTEEPGGLQSMGSQRVRHDWVTSLSLLIVLLGQNLLFWVHASSSSSRGESILCLFQLLRAGDWPSVAAYFSLYLRGHDTFSPSVSVTMLPLTTLL